VNRRTLLVVLALIVVGGLVVAGWVTWSGRIAADVAVTWSPQSPTCQGTTVKRAGSQRPIIEAKETMRCVITVEVTNRSGRTVHVAHAVAPVVGPRTGAVVTAENAQRAAKGGKYDIDALFPIDRDLEAGKSTAFDVVLVLHPGGCNDSGTLWSSNWPTVTVSVLGRSYDLHGNKDFAFRREGATPGCQRLEG
jgi:hypothetical protein